MADLTGATWRKSTRSGDNGGNCVEVADNLSGAVAGPRTLRLHQQAAIRSVSVEEFEAMANGMNGVPMLSCRRVVCRGRCVTQRGRSGDDE